MANASFITVAELSSLLGRDVSSDPGAQLAVDAACDICRDIAEQDFNAGTATIVLDGTGGDTLILPQRPVTAAGTITVNGIAETNYMFTDSGLLFRGTAGSLPRPAWPRGRQNITVTYEHGYSTANVPNSVKQVARQIAARALVQGVAKQETIGDTSVSYAVNASDLDANELRILRKYKGPQSL